MFTKKIFNVGIRRGMNGGDSTKEEEIKNLIFFDLETTGLFNDRTDDPRIPPRSIPGDSRRNAARIFEVYANQCIQYLRNFLLNDSFS